MDRREFLSTVAGLGAVATAGCTELSLGNGELPDAAAIRTRTHERINEVRADHDLSQLAYDPALQEIAAYHSEDMADGEYFAHTSPDGETRADRYEKFDYDCRAPVPDGGYATGGENIWNVNYSGTAFTAEEIAERAVTDWMNSPTHRENILHDFWRREGLGVAMREDDKVRVYLTQNFC